MADTTSDQPPSYAAIFGKLKEASNTTDGPGEYFKESSGLFKKVLGGVLCLSLLGVCCCAIGVAIPITQIVIGALHVQDCPIERLVPMYLIVSGACALVSAMSNGGMGGRYRMAKKDEEEGKQCANNKEQTPMEKFHNFGNGVLTAFTMIWSIAGSVWVFQIYTVVQYDPTKTNYCHPLVYRFAFWILIVHYIFMGLAILMCCCCCMCCCCAYSKGKKAGVNQNQSQVEMGQSQGNTGPYPG